MERSPAWELWLIEVCVVTDVIDSMAMTPGIAIPILLIVA